MTATLAGVLITIFGTLGTAKLAAVPAMRTAAADLGFSPHQYRAIGALELGGALGVGLGLHVKLLGIAASVGLTLLMIGAAVAHRRRGDAALRAAIPLVLAGTAIVYAAALN